METGAGGVSITTSTKSRLLDRAQHREQVLAEAAEYLTSSRSPGDVLRELPNLLVPSFSEWASVVLKSGRGRYVRVAEATSNEQMRPLLSERVLRIDPDATAGIAAVIRTGRSELHPDLPETVLDSNQDRDLAKRGKEAGFRSAVLVPLRISGQVVGAVNASSSQPGEFGPADVLFLERFSHLAGIAVQNARMVEELRTHNEQLRIALDAAPIYLFGQDVELRYTWVRGSKRADPGERVIGHTDDAIFSPEDATLVQALKRRAIDTGTTVREELSVFYAGMRRTFDLIAEPRFDAAGNVEGITCAAYDVTGPRRTEQALRESEQRLRMATGAAELGVFEWDLRTAAIHWENARMFEILGRSEDEGALGTQAFLELIAPEDRLVLGLAMADAMTPGKQLHCQFRTRRANDGELRWLELSGAFQLDEHQRPVVLVGVMVDVTEREAASEELRQALATKDEFLGLVSHELRTPMTLVLGFAHALERQLETASEEARTTAHEMVVEADRLAGLIENMLVLARVDREPPTTEVFDARQVVRRSIELQRSRFPLRRVDLELGPGLLVGEGRESWVELVVDNLLSNAEKYSPAGEPISVAVAREDRWLLITVGDHGDGLSEAEAENVFEPFYRSDNALNQPGLGLGLTVCKRLVTLQGGDISAYGRPRGGTEMTFRLRAVSTPD